MHDCGPPMFSHWSQSGLLTHQKRVPISGVISPLFAYSWIDNCYYFISMVHGLLSFESLSHCTYLAIFNAIVCGDLISYTCIISDVVLDHDKNTGIGASEYAYIKLQSQ